MNTSKALDTRIVVEKGCSVFVASLVGLQFLGDLTRELDIREALRIQRASLEVSVQLGMLAPASSATRFTSGIGAGVKIFPHCPRLGSPL
jgi:hypothetical protein